MREYRIWCPSHTLRLWNAHLCKNGQRRGLTQDMLIHLPTDAFNIRRQDLIKHIHIRRLPLSLSWQRLEIFQISECQERASINASINNNVLQPPPSLAHTGPLPDSMHCKFKTFFYFSSIRSDILWSLNYIGTAELNTWAFWQTRNYLLFLQYSICWIIGKDLWITVSP